MAYLYTQQILDTECIGNSLNDKINPNFLSLDNTIQSLSATTQTLTNKPVFKSYLSSSQAIPNGGTVKVELSLTLFNVRNFWDTLNYQFRPTVAGYYQFNAGIYSPANLTNLLAIIYKNGGEYVRGAASARVSHVSDIIYLNGTSDFVDLRAFQQTGTSANITTGASPGASTFMSGYLI